MSILINNFSLKYKHIRKNGSSLKWDIIYLILLYIFLTGNPESKPGLSGHLFSTTLIILGDKEDKFDFIVFLLSNAILF